MAPLPAGLPALLAGFLVKTTVVLTLALIAMMASRRRPAAFRHFLLSAALIGLLLLPVLTVVPVGWRSDLVPAWLGPFQIAGGGRGTPVLGKAEVAKPGLSVPGGTWGVLSIALPAGTRGTSTEASPRAASLGEAPTDRTEPASVSIGTSVGAKRIRRSALALGLALVWAAGAAALGLRLAFGLAGAVRLTAEGAPLRDPAWRVLLERFLALVSLRRPVRLRSHPAVLVPLTWGWRRPVVLLPKGADDWTDDERSSALFHELSHIKRADFLVMLLVRTSLALFWWNPLCWVVYRELLKEQEIACDELVLRAGIRPSTYAASLLAFRRSAGFRWNPSAALLGLLGRSSFQERLAAILKQKLTFMEVKMRTKIMLALALVLAVAAVGTARPAAGHAMAEAKTALVPTEIVAPASLDVAPDGLVAAAQTQAEQAAQEKAAMEAKKAQAEKKEKQAERTIVIKPAVVEGQPLEIVITQGDEVKTLRFDKPVTIIKKKDGDALVLSVDGKDIEVLKGEPLRLTIKGGDLEIIKEGQAVGIGEGEPFKIAKRIGEKDGQVIYYFTPGKEGRESAFRIAKKMTDKNGVEIVVETGNEGKPAISWTAKGAEKGQGVWIAKSEAGEPVTMTWTAKSGQNFAFSPERDKEMLAKVRALQEQVEAIKAKKMDISKLEESLKRLEQELQANAEKLKEMNFKLEKLPGEFRIVKRIGEDEPEKSVAVWVSEKEGRAAIATTKVEIAEGKTEGSITMVFTGLKGAEGKANAERATAALKKALPEGYTITGQKYDEEDGTIRFEVKGPEGQKTDEALIKKLVGTVKDALKKADAAK
jgi:beta-lactamase regulating signal transducer with metallopeptidase domain